MKTIARLGVTASLQECKIQTIESTVFRYKEKKICEGFRKGLEDIQSKTKTKWNDTATVFQICVCAYVRMCVCDQIFFFFSQFVILFLSLTRPWFSYSPRSVGHQ